MRNQTKKMPPALRRAVAVFFGAFRDNLDILKRFPVDIYGSFMCFYVNCRNYSRGKAFFPYWIHLIKHHYAGEEVINEMIIHDVFLLKFIKKEMSAIISYVDFTEPSWNEDKFKESLDDASDQSSDSRCLDRRLSLGSVDKRGCKRLVSIRGVQLRRQILKYGGHMFVFDEYGKFRCFFENCQKKMGTNISRHIAMHERKSDVVDPVNVCRCNCTKISLPIVPIMNQYSVFASYYFESMLLSFKKDVGNYNVHAVCKAPSNSTNTFSVPHIFSTPNSGQMSAPNLQPGACPNFETGLAKASSRPGAVSGSDFCVYNNHNELNSQKSSDSDPNVISFQNPLSTIENYQFPDVLSRPIVPHETCYCSNAKYVILNTESLRLPEDSRTPSLALPMESLSINGGEQAAQTLPGVEKTDLED